MSDAELRLEYIGIQKTISLQNVLQSAFKTVNNAAYGALGNVGFIFYDPRIAIGVTTTGRYIIQHVSNHFEKRVNTFFKTEGKSRLIYCDTDSNFFTFGDIVEKHYKGKTDFEITTALDNLMENHLRKYIDEATDNIAKRQNYYKKTIFFKREKICSSGFMLSAKKYALKVYDNEGVRYTEPDYAITGIEVVRSSTPQIARDALKKCVIHVINKDKEKMQDVVAKTHDLFMNAPPEAIAFPRGVNNLLKYSNQDNIYTKGTPIAVRASLVHNHYIEKLGIGNEYQPIEEGSKILFLYTKEPNHFKENVIAFIDKLPKQFKLDESIDRELQFEKVFIAPLQGIMTAVGWEIEEKSTLDSFFE